MFLLCEPYVMQISVDPPAFGSDWIKPGILGKPEKEIQIQNAPSLPSATTNTGAFEQGTQTKMLSNQQHNTVVVLGIQ